MRKPPDLIFKCLADPTRRSIFEHLCRDGRVTVRGLTGEAGISQPAVSKHLRMLKRAGLVRGARQGRETYYSVFPRGARPLFDWIRHYRAFWPDRFARLDAVLAQMP
ncbi:MAG TPA: metalloregulator ArsR/SmtB family transcription factor [Opitutaceae bacterium]|nr:metalloregulator ArsR/SmtB family transcription factor [Opitutaceae bacterium]